MVISAGQMDRNSQVSEVEGVGVLVEPRSHKWLRSWCHHPASVAFRLLNLSSG